MTKKQTENKSKISTLKNLISYIKPYKFLVIKVILALIITSVAILALGYSLKILIDNGFVTQDYNHLILTFSAFIVIIFILAISSYIRSSNVYVLSENIESDIKKQVFSHIISLPIEFFEVNKVSDIISRLTVDTTVINGVIINALSFITRNFIMFVGGMCFLLILNVKLTFIVLAIIPVIAFTIIKLSKKMRFYSTKAQEKIAIISSRIDESLNGIKTVQSFGAENFEIDYFNKTISEAKEVSHLRYKYRALLAASLISCVLLSIAVVLWVGSVDIINGKMTPGELSSFVFYAILVAASITGIGDVIGEMNKAAASADRIFELLNSSYKSQKTNSNILSIEEAPKIEFKNIGFSYPSRKDITIFKDLSFTIDAGQTVAIVGHSGSGKSTIINLIMKFYQPTNGNILINDTNIDDIDNKSLRDIYALVPQDTMIFSASALENIKYSNQNASDKQIIQAAKDAEIYEFLNGLPEGMDSFVGEKGIRLSGGQKQRIAIARAILKNPKILLLDEATSSLDNENERLVQIALERLQSGRTTIVVAHRFSTITNADKIILLNNGSIEAIGNYNELIENNEMFKKLAGKMR
jgi:ATP-binding cassette, subfamily B, bacterial